MESYFSNTQDPSSESRTDSEDTRTHRREHTTGTSPHHQQSASYLAFLVQIGSPEVCRCVLSVLDYMGSLRLNLPILLWALSWNNAYPDLISSDKARFARTVLTTSDLLPGILKLWHRPPRAHNRGVHTEAARRAMEDWALDTVCTILDRESDDLEDYLKFPQEELSEEALLAIKWDEMISEVKILSPVTWRVFQHAASTPRQEKRNRLKTPETAVLTMISMASMSRSHHRCKLAKLLTIYFRSCGLLAKAFDTLHALGLTMSQKWVYTGINTLTQQQQVLLVEDIKKYPWFGVHDNINIPFRAFQQRIENQNHFDSGTAATILVLKNPLVRWPDRNLRMHQRTLGANNLISGQDIFKLTTEAGPRIDSHAISVVLRFLVDSPDFDLDTYAFKEDRVFSPCPPGHQLPVGKDYIPRQYVLKTAHIEEASYEGNARVLEEWWKQLDRGTLDRQRDMGKNETIVWVGDQLTVARLRGLQNFRSEDHNGFDRLDFLVPIFGWFHAQIAVEHSIHNQYYGTRQGFGLVHAFDLLKRKGLSSPSIQGTFHNQLREGLLHITEACFRDLWCVVGKVENLKDMRKYPPLELRSMASRIVTEYASSEGMFKISAQGERCNDLLYQSIQMAHNLLDYVLLNRAISSGDVGLLEDLLPRLLFRYIGGGSGNYTTEILELLQGLHREWPTDLKDFIRQNCWLVNMTGKPNTFQPIDLLQEHNVRDIKYTFGTSGPNVSWDYIGEISASIPCQRKVKDHVEQTLNHLYRGKSHTSPEKEKDVARLQASYHDSKIHQKIQGRKLESKNKAKDYIGHGTQGQVIVRVIDRWSDNHVHEQSSGEHWESERSEQM